MLQLLRGLRKVSSLSLITQPESFLFHEAQKSGIPCAGIDFFAGRLDPRVPIRLAKVLKEWQPQVVHVHGGRAAFFFALSGCVVPSLYTVHGFHFVHKPLPIRWLAVQAERLALRHASHVVFVSRYDQELAEGFGLLPDQKPATLIHNGIASLQPRDSGQSQPGLIGFIGRLEPQKDPLLFLTCMEELQGYRAVMIGSGSLEVDVRREIERRRLSDRVTLRGALSHEETLREMREFQVLVMTSRWEGLPLLALEAMWMAIPVIASDVGGMSEIIDDGWNGLLVRERTPTAFAAAVARVCKQAAFRESLVRQALTKVEREFSEQAMLDRLYTLYEEVSRMSATA